MAFSEPPLSDRYFKRQHAWRPPAENDATPHRPNPHKQSFQALLPGKNQIARTTAVIWLFRGVAYRSIQYQGAGVLVPALDALHWSTSYSCLVAVGSRIGCSGAGFVGGGVPARFAMLPRQADAACEPPATRSRLAAPFQPLTSLSPPCKTGQYIRNTDLRDQRAS